MYVLRYLNGDVLVNLKVMTIIQDLGIFYHPDFSDLVFRSYRSFILLTFQICLPDIPDWKNRKDRN